MTRRVDLLYRLQRIDTGVMSRTRRYKKVKANLGESKALIEAKTQLQTAQTELDEWRATLRQREHEVKQIEDKQRETEKHLYDGSVHSHKELGDLQKDNEYLKRHQAILEESMLEAMMRVDELTEAAAVANEAHVVIESTWRIENAELVKEFETLRQELGQLLAKRKGWIKKVSNLDLKEYELIRKNSQGIAVTTTQDDICQICHVRIPTHAIDLARDSDQLVYCIGCDRIVYLPQA